jgi:hypothetical protein
MKAAVSIFRVSEVVTVMHACVFKLKGKKVKLSL